MFTLVTTIDETLQTIERLLPLGRLAGEGGVPGCVQESLLLP
ncbi:hypothetical protein [Phormidesmis priestleyi]|nr:hypothetical protein [Phormidesmis priestleyi]